METKFPKWRIAFMNDKDGNMKEDIQEYFKREVLPYAPDAWIDESTTKLGYEIPMTRYFYEYAEPESIETIEGRISDLEKKIADSVNAVFHGEQGSGKRKIESEKFAGWVEKDTIKVSSQRKNAIWCNF